MAYTVSIYLRMIVNQLRSQMQYRTAFLLDILSTGLGNSFYFAGIYLIFQRFGSIAGWTIGEIAFLAGMAELSFGTMDMLFSGFDPDYFSAMVRLGQFDQVMLRPINITAQVFGARFLTRRLGRILEGVVILWISFLLNPIRWTIGKVLYLPVIYASLVIGFGSLFLFGSTLIFWTIQPIEAVNIVTYGGNEMASYPMSIYPRWLRDIFTYAVPLLFLNFLPSLYILGKPDPLHFPVFAQFLAPVIAALMMWAALRFWRFGINHYQSTGT
jgi:ABC-2 type transport system permease protein